MAGLRPRIRTALGRGLRKRCPHCGIGPLFSGWARHLERCSACGLVYERNPGDTWAFTIIGDRLPIAAIIVLIYFGFVRSHMVWGVVTLAALGVVLVWTAPNRWGAGMALHYLSRAYWPDRSDPIPELPQRVETRSEEGTAAAGRELAATLKPSSVVLLSGDLGAGKTAFVRGLADGLGVGPDQVSSPTFTLIQEYRGGRLPLFHVDLYRLNDPREIEELGLDELGGDSVLAIEWAEKLPKPPAGAIVVRIEHGDGDLRTISIR